ncbi:uncharacterized protein LOC129457209 [Periophthalmus magnuspinnatus]|uniref:uncharacterized protein LOC129457209 n=1 Tax=Periophthalmus magnuspinnatus TaxID=409849 RepID=UPI00243685B4|nr:uncharacterized protein LOC129457209 [Periophthalmus magnuspinnatus]
MDSPWVWSLLCSYLIAVLCETTQGVTLEAPDKTPWLGDSVTVRCVGSDIDMEKMSLYKDDRLVTEDVSHQIRRTNTRVELTISSVSDTDDGVYTCVSNDWIIYGQSRHIWIWAFSWIVPDQGSVALECSVEDFENPQWLRRSSLNVLDFEILNEHKTRISVTRGGVYSCRGVDTLIITKETNAIDIMETGLPLLMPSGVFIRDTVILRCVGPSNENLHFYKDGVIVKTDTNHQFKRTSETTVEMMIVSASGSDQGGYSCGMDGATLYTTKALRIHTDRSRSIELSADSLLIPERGRVMLSCEIESIQKYQWIRRTSTHTSHFEILNEATAKVYVHHGGVYSCRGKEELILTPESDFVTIWETVSNGAVVQPEPDWTEVFVGESLYLRCEVEDEGNSQWIYEWRRTGVDLPTATREYALSNVSESVSGNYSCRGRGAYQRTQWSQVTKLQVIDKAVPVVSVSPSWLSPGASVSLNCDVTSPSAGWRFYWYQAVPLPSGLYSYELLSGDTSGTAHASFSVHGLSSTTGFVCRAARGTDFYTEYSPPRFVWSADAGSRVAPDVFPKSSQHLTMDKVSVSCGPGSSDEEWRVQMFSLTTKSLQQCRSHTTEHTHTCEFSAPPETRAVFWCESGTGQMSDAVNITIHDAVVLLIPALPVPEGHAVSVSCKLRHSATFSFVHFYKDGQLIQKDSSRQYNISAVSKSDQGSYRCELQESAQQVLTSPESWLSVTCE